MKVTEAKRGQVVEIDGALWTIVGMDFTKPGKGPGYYQITFKNLERGNVNQKRMQGDDQLKFAFVENRNLEYLYQEGDDYVFMDTESYEQINLPGDLLTETIPYVRHNAVVRGQFYDEKFLGLDLPASVVLKVLETDPSARGDTVKNVTKPATLETNVVVKVPAHIKPDEWIKVDPREGKFLSRASENEIPSDE